MDVLALLLIALIVILAIERALAVDDRSIDGRDLEEWVRRLQSNRTEIRDSAIAAVRALALRKRETLASEPLRSTELPEADQRRNDALVRAAFAIAARLGDSDSLVREQAVPAVIEISAPSSHGGSAPHRDMLDVASIRIAVRRSAANVLQIAATDQSQSGAILVSLEVLATIGVPAEQLPLAARLAMEHPSAAIRELAAIVVLRTPRTAAAAAVLKDRVVLAATTDSSADVRMAVIEEVLRDSSIACMSEDIRRRLRSLREAPDNRMRALIDGLDAAAAASARNGRCSR